MQSNRSELARRVDEPVPWQKGNPQLADRLQVVLTERLADSKQVRQCCNDSQPLRECFQIDTTI